MFLSLILNSKDFGNVAADMVQARLEEAEPSCSSAFLHPTSKSRLHITADAFCYN